MGVQTAHQLYPLTLADTLRALPSAMHTWMPPRPKAVARLGSQSGMVGETWNFD